MKGKAVMKKKRETPVSAQPAKESVEKEVVRELLTAEEKSGRIRMFSAISALLCCGVSLYLQNTPVAIFCLGLYLVLMLNKLPPFLERHGGKIFIAVSALIVCFGIVTRIIVYVIGRSLWVDEALLAESIVSRSWGELLASPLSNDQSAPVLYVVTVKAVCSVLGYSEFSLRIFSFLSFLGLLVCEWFFLKKILKIDDTKTAAALVLTVVLPSFLYYSNELKPYMGDAFFVVLAILLYAFYAQNKISLVKLTVFYVLILGFCTPSVFFIGGVLTVEFLAAAFAKDKKHAVQVAISGLSIVALFGLYYYWWLSPQVVVMDDYWNKSQDKSGLNAFSTLIVILLYFLYTRKKMSLVILNIFYVLILCICPPAAVFAGVILAGELFAAAFAGDKKRTLSILASVLSIAAVFGLYYEARTAFVSEALNGFWNNPQGKTDMANGIKNIFLAFNVNSKLVWALVPFALFGIYSLVKQKNKVAYSVVCSIFFVCFASSIGKWPANGRLWLFLPAVVLVFSSVGFDVISKGGNAILRKTAFCVFLAVTVHYIGVHPLSLWGVANEGGIRDRMQEVNPLIKYVQEHIKEGEKLYVYPPARYTLMFKNGYNSNRIGQTAKDNIIYGVNREEWNQSYVGAELDTIIKSRKAYLLFQHYASGINPGLTVLSEYGTISTVLDNYGTPLLYFEVKE